MIVLKFGGSSVDGGENIAGVADLVAGRSEPRLVVVSAMGKITSELQRLAARAASGELDAARQGLATIVERHEAALARAAGEGAATAWVREAIAAEAERVAQELARIAGAGEVSPRANDAVVSLGELLSSRLLAAALASRGVAAQWIDPRDLVTTDDGFGGARPDRARIHRNAQRLARPAMERGTVVVTGGYVGRAKEGGAHGGETTTMGRESSDLSATLLGGALRAEAVEIWTDVDGILTADPRLVPAARLVPNLSYQEAACLASLGAKVIHPDTVAPAASAGAAIRIRNRFHPESPGSTIGEQGCPSPLWGIAAREALLHDTRGKVVKVRFPVEGSWALQTGYRLGSVPLQLKVAKPVLEHVGRTPRVLVSVVGRIGELGPALVEHLRWVLRDLDAVPVPGRGRAVSQLLPLGEAREAVERLHRAAFEEPLPASVTVANDGAGEPAARRSRTTQARALAAPACRARR